MVTGFKRRLPYIIASVVLLSVELVIGLFVHDTFVRPYIGDVLVTVLLCCLGRIVFLYWRFLPLAVLIFSVSVELLQLAELDELLGIQGSVFGIIIGSTFDIADIICYTVGCVLFFAVEYFVKKKKPSTV